MVAVGTAGIQTALRRRVLMKIFGSTRAGYQGNGEDSTMMSIILCNIHQIVWTIQSTWMRCVGMYHVQQEI
jgi:hypothetical protein